MASYYDVLGVTSTATAEELRRAYRRAVKEAHPDTGGSAEAFTRVQAAWDALRDPARRAAYDQRNAGVSNNTPSSGSAGEWRSTSARRTYTPPAPPPPRPTVRPPHETQQSTPAAADAGPTASESADTRAVPRWRRVALVALALITLASAALTGWGLAQLGRLAIVGVIAYLAAVAAAFPLRAMGHPAGEGTYRRVSRAAWVLAGLLAIFAALSWAIGRDPAPPIIWTVVVATFATALGGTWHLARGLIVRRTAS